MFGANEIVGQRYFEKAEDKLFITSIFFTLQGEGPYAGMPAVFVRFAKCNLACSFCDTYFDGGDWLTLEQISDKIDKTIKTFFNGNIPFWAQYNCVEGDIHKKREIVLVVTGGEPMLQKNIVPFLEYFDQQFNWTQIESNGTVYQPIPSYTTLVVSPKCSTKKGKAVKYLNPKDQVLERADCLKFVIEADPTSPYHTVPQWALDWSKDARIPIYVSPMNVYNTEPQNSKQLRASNKDITIDERSNVDEVISFWETGLLDMESNQRNHEYAAKYCINHGLRLNLQMHLYASLA